RSQPEPGPVQADGRDRPCGRPGENRRRDGSPGGQGAPGSGKSTAARILADSSGRSVLVAGDAFFASLARGAIEPWLPEAGPQNEIVVRSMTPPSSKGPGNPPALPSAQDQIGQYERRPDRPPPASHREAPCTPRSPTATSVPPWPGSRKRSDSKDTSSTRSPRL